MNVKSKHYNVFLTAPLEIDLCESTVREMLEKDLYDILTDEDWKQACGLFIQDFLKFYHIDSLPFTFTFEEQIEE